eukprot:1179029-Prorocentrum_minimum.AAC.3
MGRTKGENGKLLIASELKVICDQCDPEDIDEFPAGHYYTPETGFVKFYNPSFMDPDFQHDPESARPLPSLSLPCGPFLFLAPFFVLPSSFSLPSLVPPSRHILPWSCFLHPFLLEPDFQHDPESDRPLPESPFSSFSLLSSFSHTDRRTAPASVRRPRPLSRVKNRSGPLFF